MLTILFRPFVKNHCLWHHGSTLEVQLMWYLVKAVWEINDLLWEFWFVYNVQFRFVPRDCVWWEWWASDKFRTELLQISKAPAHCCLCQFLMLCRCRVWEVDELLHCSIVRVLGLTWSKGQSALETSHFHALDYHKSSTTSLNLALRSIFRLHRRSYSFIQMTIYDDSTHCTILNVTSLFKNALESLQTLQPSLRNLGSRHL